MAPSPKERTSAPAGEHWAGLLTHRSASRHAARDQRAPIVTVSCPRCASAGRPLTGTKATRVRIKFRMEFYSQIYALPRSRSNQVSDASSNCSTVFTTAAVRRLFILLTVSPST